MEYFIRMPRKLLFHRLEMDQLKFIDELFSRLSEKSKEIVFTEGPIRIRASLHSLTKFKRVLQLDLNVIGQTVPLQGESLSRYVVTYEDITNILNKYKWEPGTKV